MAKLVANGHNKPTTIKIAEGTEYERVVELKILRGKKYRDMHLKLLETFSDLEVISKNDGSGQLKGIIKAIEELFTNENIDFEGQMLPFALGMESEEDKEYLSNLLPLEQFMAYTEAAAFIVNGGKSVAVQAALKK